MQFSNRKSILPSDWTFSLQGVLFMRLCIQSVHCEGNISRHGADATLTILFVNTFKLLLPHYDVLVLVEHRTAGDIAKARLSLRACKKH